jgi:hypothetical protein
MQAVLNLIWDRLLPGFQAGAIAEDRAGLAALRSRLAGLKVKPAEGAATSPEAAKVLGKKYGFAANDQKLESLALKADALSLVMNGVALEIPFGHQEWKRGKGTYGAYTNEPAAATGAWSKDDTCVVKQVFYETPYYLTATLRFAGNEVTCAFETNVGFGATKKPALTGRSE